MSQGGHNGECQEQAEHCCRCEQSGLQFIHVIDPSLKWYGRENRVKQNPGSPGKDGRGATNLLFGRQHDGNKSPTGQLRDAVGRTLLSAGL